MAEGRSTATYVNDNERVATETKAYTKISQVRSFTDTDGKDILKQEIETNYRQVKQDIVQLIKREMQRITNDPDLQHLVQQE